MTAQRNTETVVVVQNSTLWLSAVFRGNGPDSACRLFFVGRQEARSSCRGNRSIRRALPQ